MRAWNIKKNNSKKKKKKKKKKKENWLMKNKNIKNNPQKYGRWFFLQSRFSKISRGGLPDFPYKRHTSIKPSKSFFNNNSRQRQNQRTICPVSLT